MTIYEAHMQELKKLKGKPLKTKIAHIVTYYWIPIVAVAVAAIILISVITGFITQKDTVLQGYVINAVEKAEITDTFRDDLAQHLKLTEKQQIILQSNLRTSDTQISDTLQVLSVQTAAQDIDFLVCDTTGCQTLLYYDYYSDLNTLLDKDHSDRLSDWFVYCERSALERTDPSAKLELGSRDTMKDPVAVAIRIPAETRLTEAYMFADNTAYILLMPNTRRLEAVEAMLDFLLPEA